MLVMRSRVVLNNTSRKLNIEEFRGFALVDDLAPVVFINGVDSKSAQMFTLAHELAHLWLGQEALSSASIAGDEDKKSERWCNAVAAETLVPFHEFTNQLVKNERLDVALPRLSKKFKVSTLVILRRLLDARQLSRGEYSQAYKAELENIPPTPESGGGNFYHSIPHKMSRNFLKALVISTLEGHTLYRDALRMLGLSKISTFMEIGRKVGVVTK